jgi:hypothetical protein
MYANAKIGRRMPSTLSRRLEDRIRELCFQVACAQDLNFPEALSDLQIALNEFAQLQIALADFKRRFGNKTSTTILTWPGFPNDRRRASSDTPKPGVEHERQKEAQKNARNCG